MSPYPVLLPARLPHPAATLQTGLWASDRGASTPTPHELNHT